MNRFISSQRKEYHNTAISEFSDLNRPISSGVSRAFTGQKQTWIADFLFKNKSNLSVNKHVANLSFFSDYDIFMNEYGNIADLSANYKFFSSYERSILSPYSFELTTSQYKRIGQKTAELDVVEYFNKSSFYKFNVANQEIDFSFIHEFTKLPMYHAEGYVVSEVDGSNPTYYRRYLWTDPYLIDYSSISDYLAALRLHPWLSDIRGRTIEYIMTQTDADVDRIVDMKLDVENPEFFYFTDDSAIYYNDVEHYFERKFRPYIQPAIFYNTDWTDQKTVSEIYYLPEIICNGALEPAKILPIWSTETSEGECAINGLCHNGEADDQSGIIYSACKNMTLYDVDSYKICTMDPNDNTILGEGIDVETERNRRYSSIIMTEPYFVTEPICGGKLCYYTFITAFGNPAFYEIFPDDFIGSPTMYLKLKASNDIITEIDRLLGLNEINEDIINTVTINLVDVWALLNSSGGYLDDFASTVSVFFKRQENCLDDLHDLMTSARSYTVYTIPAIGSESDWYSDDLMKVSGMGYFSIHEKIISGSYIERQYINLYCNNFEPIAPYEYGVSDPTPAANNIVSLITYTSFSNSIVYGERFKPMIKIPGINGYIKILSRNKKFKVTKSNDGLSEVVYSVEFPYAPGSYLERARMQFDPSNPYKPTFILYKKTYIPAGSRGKFLTAEPGGGR